jgi:ferredoxin
MGKNIIFYFSGTGNSKKVANDISMGMENCEVKSISNYIVENLNERYERIGISFPVYAWGPPNTLINFIRDNRLIFKDSYVYVIATFKNEPGASVNLISNLLQRMNLKLHAGFYVPMPGNHVVHYEIEDKAIINIKLEQWDRNKIEIIKSIKEKRNTDYRVKSINDRIIKTGVLYRIARRQFRVFDKKFVVNESCNGCKTCERICPVNNIVVINGKPKWRNVCEECLACLNWCSRSAINWGDITLRRGRYHHPDIKLIEMIQKKT